MDNNYNVYCIYTKVS